MGIDWHKVNFLAVDGKSSIWTYATDRVGEDMAALREQLSRHIEYELVAARRGIAIIFHADYEDIARTIDTVADKIISEAQKPP